VNPVVQNETVPQVAMVEIIRRQNENITSLAEFSEIVEFYRALR